MTSGWPYSLLLPAGIVFITPFHFCSIAGNLDGIPKFPAGASWPTANKAFYYPFRIAQPFLARKAVLHNGGAAAGNLDIGVYSAAGTRLFSTGSTAMSGTNAIQEVDITDFLLGPGLYYLALAMSSTSAQVFKVALANATSSRMLGCAEQTSAFALPATATLAVATTADVYKFGISGRVLI